MRFRLRRTPRGLRLAALAATVLALLSAPGARADVTPPSGGEVLADLHYPTGPQYLTMAPWETTSGWQIKEVIFTYVAKTDTLDVDIKTTGIAGDADGSGHPGGPDPRLTAAGGVNPANLGGLDSITVAFAAANANHTMGAGVAVAGVPEFKPADAPSDGFRLAQFLQGDPLQASYGNSITTSVGTLLYSPSAQHPDFEFTIQNFSKLFGMDLTNGFYFSAYAGSPDDEVVGEDKIGWTAVKGFQPEQQIINPPAPSGNLTPGAPPPPTAPLFIPPSRVNPGPGAVEPRSRRARRIGRLARQPPSPETCGGLTRTGRAVHPTCPRTRPIGRARGPRALRAGRQQRECRPAGGREPLGVALAASGPRRLRPRAVGELHADQGRAAPGQRRSHVELAAESGQGDQRQRRVERFGRCIRIRAPSPGLPLGPPEDVEGCPGYFATPISRHFPLGEEDGRGIDDADDRAGSDPTFGSGDPIGMADGVGAAEDAGGQGGRQPSAIGRRRADRAAVLDRPRTVVRLVGREPSGGPAEGLPEPVPSGLDGRRQGQAELDPRQPLVARRAVAAILVPSLGPGEPGDRVGHRRRVDRQPRGLGPEKGPRGVAIIVARVAMVLARPPRDLRREVGDGLPFRLVATDLPRPGHQA